MHVIQTHIMHWAEEKKLLSLFRSIFYRQNHAHYYTVKCVKYRMHLHRVFQCDLLCPVPSGRWLSNVQYFLVRRPYLSAPPDLSQFSCLTEKKRRQKVETELWQIWAPLFSQLKDLNPLFYAIRLKLKPFASTRKYLNQ